LRCATNGPEGSSSLPIGAPNDEPEKRPQADNALGADATQTLTPPGDRMAQPPGSTEVSAAPREYNVDHGLVWGVGVEHGPPLPTTMVYQRLGSLIYDRDLESHL